MSSRLCGWKGMRRITILPTTPRALILSAALSFAPMHYAGSRPLTYTLPDETSTLKPGRGPAFEATQNNCLSCHSSDYIKTQPPKRGKAFWDAEVTKMIKVYHAPISDADAKLIGEYLAEAY
jgi:mono/diheme cytochrome c family protein